MLFRSDLSELYYDFATYRLEMMEERIRKKRLELMARHKAGEKFDTLGVKQFLDESVGFLEHTDNEIVEDSKVVPGIIPKDGRSDFQVPASENTRASKRARRN